MNQSSSYNWSIHSNCGDVNYLYSSIYEQCNFTQTVLECSEDDGFVNYIQLTYCTIASESYSTMFLLFLLFILFFAIGTNADDFLCPLLISISRSLKLSDNIAGVTFLAFGNGAPDIFSSIIGIADSNPNMVIGQLYGAGIFVTTMVVGSILIQRQFEIMKRPLLRDIAFYLVTTTLVWTTFLTRKIYLFHSIIFIATYLIYVMVVIISGYIYKRQQQNKQMLPTEKNHNRAPFYPRPMPRDNLNKQTKYVVNRDDDNQLKLKIDKWTESSSVKSLNFIKKNSADNDEGVVLRRIKHRQYCQNPLEQRRLTLYHINWDSGSRKVSRESQTIASNVYSITGNIGKNSNNNKQSTNNISEDNSIQDLNNNNGEFRMIPDSIKETGNNNNWIEANRINIHRRLTISDSNFIQHSTKNNELTLNDNKTSQVSLGRCFIEPIRRIFLKDEQHNDCCDEKPKPDVIIDAGADGTTNDHDDGQCSRFFIINVIVQASRFDIEIFPDLSFFGKLSMIIKAPIYLIYTFTIPVVDNELPMNGWIKKLNLAHLIISPQVCLLIIQKRNILETYQLHLMVLSISLIAFIIVHLTSQANHPPSYHILFAYSGFLVSISWIYTIATEVVNILDAVRVIFNLSKFMIGLTIGAWGNSVGDFLSNLSMAKNGFPRMAISACFGGPVLNMLLGIGIPYTILFIKQQTYEIEIEYNNMISVLYGTITISLSTTIIILLFITKFQSCKIHAFILYSIYVCFLTAAIITEMKLLG